MENFDKFRQMVRGQQDIRDAEASRHLGESKQRLQKTIETKINTTMIGAISEMEAKFGFLWGQGKPYSALTDKEIAMLRLKDEMRTAILNNGNNQKRGVIAELEQYEVEWKRHHIDIQVN